MFYVNIPLFALLLFFFVFIYFFLLFLENISIHNLYLFWNQTLKTIGLNTSLLTRLEMKTDCQPKMLFPALLRKIIKSWNRRKLCVFQRKVRFFFMFFFFLLHSQRERERVNLCVSFYSLFDWKDPLVELWFFSFRFTFSICPLPVFIEHITYVTWVTCDISLNFKTNLTRRRMNEVEKK